MDRRAIAPALGRVLTFAVFGKAKGGKKKQKTGRI